MGKNEGFFGREKEIGRWLEVLEEPKGEAVIVVGQMGMGKTMLVNKMARIAEEHCDFKCGCVR